MHSLSIQAGVAHLHLLGDDPLGQSERIAAMDALCNPIYALGASSGVTTVGLDPVCSSTSLFVPICNVFWCKRHATKLNSNH
jgi:hypothetical protein